MPGLVRSLAFAVVAALATAPWLLATAPWLGPSRSLALLVLGAAVAYVAWIAPTPRRALTAGGVAALLAGLGALFAPSFGVALAVAAAVVAVGRSVLVVRRAPARALALETGLLTVGLLAARLLAGPSPLDLALAVWGFFLVQSLYGLVGGGRRRPERPAGDAFELARRRALALIEGVPGPS